MGIQDIGDNVRRHMKIRGMTIPQLSAMMGMGTAALSNLLNGKAEPKSSTLIKLADALSVPFDELLSDAPKLSSLRFRTAKTLSGREKAERDQLLHDTATWLSDYCSLTFAVTLDAEAFWISNAHSFKYLACIRCNRLNAVANSAADEENCINVNLPSLCPDSLRFETANGISLLVRECQFCRGW